MKIASFLLLPALLLTGCYTTRIIPYAGNQQAWPTAQGSFVDGTQAVPVYFGLPARAYTYLAQVQIEARDPNVDVVKIAAQTAKAKGADALLVLDNTERPVGTSSFGSGFASANNGFGSGFSSVRYAGQIKAIAIKWK